MLVILSVWRCDKEQWCAWPAACSSFSFQGQSGRLALRKEARQRGEDHYWDLAALPQPGILVLEDYHAISNAQIHEALAALVDHLPPALHLALITRQDPPLPLARLRAHNELVELHVEDLRFSLEETHAFLARATPFQFSASTI